MTKFLAIVVAYKNPKLTLDAAISAHRQGDTRVVVWDNFSSEEMQQELVHKLPSEIQLELCPENILWAPALNRAIDRYSYGCEYIVQMNNDVQLPGATFRNLEIIFDTDPKAGMVGPLCPALGGPQEPLSAQYRPRALGSNMMPFRAAFLLGACLMYRKEVFDEIGPFDETMPLGADDHDYSIRMKHAGYHLWVQPNVCIWHKGHASDGPEWDEWGGKSWGAFNEKWGGYFATEEEAIKCHWGGEYFPEHEVGTGWSEEEYRDRSRGSNLQ